MKRILASFHRYKYLFALSLCSALIVVILQTLVNTIFSTSSQDLQNIQLEEATGEIIPITDLQTTNQLKSTLQANELKEFLANGQYEDKLPSQDIKRIDVQFEKLLVVLDGSNNSQTNIDGENVMMNVKSTVDVDTSLCTTEGQKKQSCTTYLVDKSGHSIPVMVTFLDSIGSAPSAINIRMKTDTERYSGIFAGQPLGLDIRVM